MLNCDIRELTEDVIRNAIGSQKVDIIVGGPPCQSYSTVGKRRLDERANLFLEYKRILEILRPKAFVFENVIGILSMDKGRLFRRIQSVFEELGYTLKYKVLDAVNFGVPQHRERVILVGIKGENYFVYPEETHGNNIPGKLPWVTYGDAISDLPAIKSGQTNNNYTTTRVVNTFT